MRLSAVGKALSLILERYLHGVRSLCRDRVVVKVFAVFLASLSGEVRFYYFF